MESSQNIDGEILFIGDPHFKRNNEYETAILYSEIERVLLSQKFKGCVVLGDTLDSFRKIESDVLTRAVKFLEMISLNVEILIVIIGNHDRINQTDHLTEISPFYSLKKWENTIIVDDIKSTVFSDKKILLVPYVEEGIFVESVNSYLLRNNESIDEYSLVIAHQEFGGCSLGSIRSEGEKYPEEWPLCISGHIHTYEKVGKNLYYFGTPYQQSFGDTTRKGIYSVNFSFLSRNSTKKESNGVGESHRKEEKFFFLPHTLIKLNTPKKRVVSISEEELHSFELAKGSISFLKIIISGNPKKIKKILNSKKWNSFSRIKIVIRDTTFLEVSEIKSGGEVFFSSKTTFKDHLLNNLKNEKLKEVFLKISSKIG